MGRLFSSQFLIRTLWRYTFIDLRCLDGHVAKIASNRCKNLYQMYLLFIELFIKLNIISKANGRADLNVRFPGSFVKID